MYRPRSSATILSSDRDSKLDVLAGSSSVSPLAGSSSSSSSHKSAGKQQASYTNGKENSVYKSIKGQCLRCKHKLISCVSSEQSGRNILFTVLLLLVAGLWVLHAQISRQVCRAAKCSTLCVQPSQAPRRYSLLCDFSTLSTTPFICTWLTCHWPQARVEEHQQIIPQRSQEASLNGDVELAVSSCTSRLCC